MSLERRFQELSFDIISLIKSVTEFSDDDENLSICHEFVSSNLKYHHFLAVDSHKVNRAIDGIIEKLQVHSQQPKAKALRQLVDEFLDSQLSNENAKSDTHYALLLLLLNLSDAPIKKDYQLPKKRSPVEEEEFDWTGYLLDGEDVQQMYPQDSESSEEDDTDNDDEATLRPDDSGIALNEQLLGHMTHRAVDVTIAPDEFPLQEDGRVWLERNLVAQYWKTGRGTSTPKPHRSNTLCESWCQHVSDIEPFSVEIDRKSLSEAQVCREVIWMMLGTSELYIFNFDGFNFHVRENLDVLHLTPDSLANILKMLGQYGTLVQKLNRFLECTIFSPSAQTRCATYVAFAGSLFHFIQDMNQQLVTLEKEFVRQEEAVTLSYLLHKLTPWLHSLDLLHQIYEEGIMSCQDIDSQAAKASHLLTVLFDAVISVDSYGKFRPEAVSLLLPLWIETSKPYIDIIDDWITVGNLTDYHNEFGIQRNSDVKHDDETFWDTAFTFTCHPGISSKTTAPSVNDEETKTDKSMEATEGEKLVVPSFLSPVLKEINMTGKSMELLQNLGKLADVSGTSKGQRSLYDRFLDNLENRLGTKPDTVSMDCDEDKKVTPLFKETIHHHMSSKTGHNVLLKINFEKIFCSEGYRAEQFNTMNVQKSQCLHNLECGSLRPVQLILEDCLYPYIISRYEYVSTKLLNILWKDCQLTDYLAAMRYFFLMEAGDTMYDFCREIFEKLRLHESWSDTTFLNWALQGALQVHFPHEINCLLVNIEEDKKQTRYPIHALDSLRLYYKVPWPVNLVVNSRCQKVYNQIFTFIMQIKRAKYCLDQLRFNDLEKEDLGEQKKDVDETFFSMCQSDDAYQSNLTHRMHVFKIKLLHFVNSLENYVMTRILHSTGLEFQKELSEAKDLDEVILVHNSYVTKIYERCLLPKRVSLLKEAIMKVLNLALTFQTKWDAGVSSLTLRELTDMESDFSRIVQFLASFLQNVIKRGSFPHLESLAFVIIDASEHSQVVK